MSVSSSSVCETRILKHPAIHDECACFSSMTSGGSPRRVARANCAGSNWAREGGGREGLSPKHSVRFWNPGVRSRIFLRRVATLVIVLFRAGRAPPSVHKWGLRRPARHAIFSASLTSRAVSGSCPREMCRRTRWRHSVSSGLMIEMGQVWPDRAEISLAQWRVRPSGYSAATEVG